MGVSGSGKSTVAAELARLSRGSFIDADDFHPESNRQKMRDGIPLEDEDRSEWLQRLHQVIVHHRQNKNGALFLACSALKEDYRRVLRGELAGFQILYLHGPQDLIMERMKARPDHFMSPELLQSQFDDLEEPEDAIWFDIVDPVEKIADRFFRQFPELRKSA